MSAIPSPLIRETFTSHEPLTLPPTARAGVSWAAALAGAAAAAAVSVILISLGSGLGFAVMSPFADHNPSVMGFTVMGAIWLIIVQWVSAFFGGYLAGRLRPSLTDVHTDEVGFRDTATGFVAWAVATLFIVAVAAAGATSAASGIASGIGRTVSTTVASVAGGVAQGGAARTAPEPGSGPNLYLLDTLFRPARPDAQDNAAAAKAEAGRILATGIVSGISQADHDYLVQLVAARTGLAPSDAGKRVDDVVAREKAAIDQAKQAADAARKAAAAFSIYSAVAMLIGAFIACVAAAIGGRQRDAF